jgi:AcrR family transcriptional regulator
MPIDTDSPRRGRGRPSTVSADAVAQTGLNLFLAQGFDQTTMTDIAAAAGIGRKTLFAYFPNKADIVWNRFDRQLVDLTVALAESPTNIASTDAVVDAVLRGLHTDPAIVPVMRAEVVLIQQVPALESYAHMRGRPWRDAITHFLAEREGLNREDVLPQVLGHGYWEAMFVGFRNWIRSKEVLPRPFVERALRDYSRALSAAFENEKTRVASLNALSSSTQCAPSAPK